MDPLRYCYTGRQEKLFPVEGYSMEFHVVCSGIRTVRLLSDSITAGCGVGRLTNLFAFPEQQGQSQNSSKSWHEDRSGLRENVS